MIRRLTIGRSSQADYQITEADKHISRIHLELADKGQAGLFVKDLGSSNGSYFHGARLEPHKWYQIERDAIVRLGNTYRLSIAQVLQHLTRKQPAPATGHAAEDPTHQKQVRSEGPRPYLIGRSSEADFIILDQKKRVSRLHLKVTPLARGRYLIEDLQSVNGTSVNGHLLTPGVTTEVGLSDRITLGPDYLLDLSRYFGNTVRPGQSGEKDEEGEATLLLGSNKKMTVHPDKVSIGDLASLTEDGFKTVGRDTSCDIVIDHPKVSRQHMRIRRLSENIFEMEDLGSTNKTFLEDKPLAPNERTKFLGNATIVLGGERPFELGRYFELSHDLAKQSGTPAPTPVIYQQLTPADPSMQQAFEELEALWLNYRNRRKQLGKVGAQAEVAGSATEIVAELVATWGNLAPFIGPMLTVGGTLALNWLRKRKNKKIPDELTLEDIFLESYCCPNCTQTFGHIPWKQIKYCQGCRVLYRT